MNLFDILVILLSDENAELVLSAMNMLNLIFFIKKISKDKHDLYLEEFCKCNGIEHIESLMNHSSREISAKAITLCTTCFPY